MVYTFEDAQLLKEEIRERCETAFKDTEEHGTMSTEQHGTMSTEEEHMPVV